FAAAFDTHYITGLGTVDDRMLILVDIERLMTAADMGLMEQATLQ
ncbi:MAG: chemotaxis protein CheW, partial [Burkholderiales bacterium]